MPITQLGPILYHFSFFTDEDRVEWNLKAEGSELEQSSTLIGRDWYLWRLIAQKWGVFINENAQVAEVLVVG